MINAGARLSILDLSDNAFGPIGVEGLARLLQSDVCSELEVYLLLGWDGCLLVCYCIFTMCDLYCHRSYV